MKYALILLSFSLIGLQNASAKDVTCKVKTNDLGTITGRGANESAAFEDAATQCFDRYTILNKAKDHRTPADEETQMIWIDTCANIKCG